MPSRPLSEEQKADCARLKSLFEKWRSAQQKNGDSRSHDELAESIGMKQSAFSQRLNGSMALNPESASRFARLIGSPVSTFSPSLAEIIANQAISIDSGSQLRVPEGKVLVKRIVGAHLSAGNGEVVYDFDQVSDRSFDKEWMRTRGLVADQCVLWTVKGDSMSPTIESGELVLLNLRQRELEHAKVFALVTEDGLRLKRLMRKSDNTWEIRSDNDDKRLFPTEPFVPGEVAIMGRVRWHAGEM